VGGIGADVAGVAREEEETDEDGSSDEDDSGRFHAYSSPA
jgi:hypothetical protein